MEENLFPTKPSTKELIKDSAALGQVQKSLQLSKPVDDGSSEIAILKGLGAEEHKEEIWYRLRGYDYNYFTKKWEQKSEPLMNEEGIRNLMLILTMALRMDFSFMDDKTIPKAVMHFFRTNFPQFTVYYKDFGLDLKDMNVIKTGCFLPFYIASYNARHAGHRNTIRGVLSENVFMRMASEEEKKSRNKGFFSRIGGMFQRRK